MVKYLRFVKQLLPVLLLLLLLVESAARTALPAPASDLMEAIMVNEGGEGWGCLLTSVAFGRIGSSPAAYLHTSAADRKRRGLRCVSLSDSQTGRLTWRTVL